MAQSLYFNETCDPVDLTHCSQYYVDPCDCTQFYQCAQNQLRMFHRPCGPGTIYNHKNFVCDYPNNAICQTQRPYERCNVTESRMEQIRSRCGKSTPNSNNNGNSDQNTNGISVPLITQTILPTVFGVLVLVIIIGLVIRRYRKKRIITISDGSLGGTERIITISDGSLGGTERTHERHLSDPYNSLYSFTSSIPEYCPYETLRFNPTFDVDLDSSGSSSYIIVEEFDSIPSPSTMPRASDDDRECIDRGFHSDSRPEIEIVSNEDSFNSITGQSDTTPHPLSMPQTYETDRPVPNLNSQEDELVSGGGSSYESLRGSDTIAMPQPSDADQEFANKTVSSEDSTDRSVPNFNSQEHEIASSGGSSYESIRGSDTTAMPQPSDADKTFANKTVSNEDSADIPVPNLNSQEDKIASSGGSSYESLRGSDTIAMPQPSDDDQEFANKTFSSEDSAYVVVQQSDPLFHPYVSGNGPWPHKVIFSIKDHFLPPSTTFETT